MTTILCDSCLESGARVPATGRSTHPDWSGYDLCDECIAEYDGRLAPAPAPADPTPANRAATDLVARARARHGLTQAQLAARMDPPVAPSAVSQWQNGVHAPRPGHLLQLQRLAGEAREDGDAVATEAGIAGWRAAIAQADHAIRKGPDEPGYGLAVEIARLGRATLRATFGVPADPTD